MSRYVFICCPGHSGSTLLDLVLGAHPGVVSLGEISHLPKNIALNTACSCGIPIRACEYWQEIFRLISEEKGIDVLRDPYIFSLGLLKAADVIDHEKQTGGYLFYRKIVRGLVYLEKRYKLGLPVRPISHFYESIDNNIRLFEIALKVNDAEVIVDSSKDYLKAVEIYRRYPDKVRIILLFRDGRGVLYSRIKRGVSRKEGVKSWRNYYTRGLPVLNQNVSKEHIVDVRYEDFAKDPVDSLKKLCKFIGVPYRESMLDFGSYPHHIANGNNIRFKKDMKISLDTTWTEKLSELDINYFEKTAGDLNKRLGYC